MKKVISISLICVMLCGINVFAENTFSLETFTEISLPLFEQMRWKYITNINGEEYIVSEGLPKRNNPAIYRHTIKLSEEKFTEYMANNNKDMYSSIDYVKTETGYFARSCMQDIRPGIPFRWRHTSGAPNEIKFLDENCNIIKTKTFDKCGYVYDIDYLNGVYYCTYFADYKIINNPDGTVSYETMYCLDKSPYKGFHKTVMSTDTENWTEIEGPIPRSNEAVAIKENQVALNKRDFFPVAHEDGVDKEYIWEFGEWFLKYDGNYVYLTNDNVYFVKIKMPEGFEESRINLPYEYEDKITVYIGKESSGYNISIPKQDIYSELEALKSASYVKLNNKILGFEQPPVREDDRLLVPMRFLFEQMGEEVTWNGETETATVIGTNGDMVSFSIDSTEASVNGEFKTMDVPARLVNDKTMVPLRFLSENLGCNVQWDEETKTAVITTENYTPSPLPSLQPPQTSQTTAAQQKNWFVKFIDFITFNKAA